MKRKGFDLIKDIQANVKAELAATQEQVYMDATSHRKAIYKSIDARHSYFKYLLVYQFSKQMSFWMKDYYCLIPPCMHTDYFLH